MGRFAEWLRGVLHARSADEMRGITIEGPCWEVPGKRLLPADFFRALPMLVPESALLLLEGGSHPPQLSSLFRARAVPGQSRLAVGTLWPRGAVNHLPSSAVVLSALASVCDHCAPPEVCDHLHVYQDDTVLLQWYDAFSGPFLVSKHLPQEAVETFTRELGVTFRDMEATA